MIFRPPHPFLPYFAPHFSHISHFIPVLKVKERLRGEPGTQVKLLVERDGASDRSLDITVPRKLVRLPDVSLCAMLREGVGYAKLDGFSEGTAEATRKKN